MTNNKSNNFLKMTITNTVTYAVLRIDIHCVKRNKFNLMLFKCLWQSSNSNKLKYTRNAKYFIF